MWNGGEDSEHARDGMGIGVVRPQNRGGLHMYGN